MVWVHVCVCVCVFVYMCTWQSSDQNTQVLSQENTSFRVNRIPVFRVYRIPVFEVSRLPVFKSIEYQFPSQQYGSILEKGDCHLRLPPSRWTLHHYVTEVVSKAREEVMTQWYLQQPTCWPWPAWCSVSGQGPYKAIRELSLWLHRTHTHTHTHIGFG